MLILIITLVCDLFFIESSESKIAEFKLTKLKTRQQLSFQVFLSYLQVATNAIMIEQTAVFLYICVVSSLAFENIVFPDIVESQRFLNKLLSF